MKNLVLLAVAMVFLAGCVCRPEGIFFRNGVFISENGTGVDVMSVGETPFKVSVQTNKWTEIRVMDTRSGK